MPRTRYFVWIGYHDTPEKTIDQAGRHGVPIRTVLLVGNDDVSIAGASEIMPHIEPDRFGRARRIREVTAGYFRVRVSDLERPGSRGKRDKIGAACHVAMFLINKHTDLSLREIGGMFGGRDHSTVISACRKVADGLDARTRVGAEAVERMLIEEGGLG
jgi:chromosomal replication initiation ATPase DnaA